MKKKGRRILTVLLGITVCLSLFLIATPAKATLEPNEITISLGTVASDNFMTISNAFAMADFEHLLTVRIETPGTYYVGLSGYPDALRIRSNTIFDLNGSTLIRAGGMANIIQNVDFNGSRDNGTGYTQTYNFTIKNGTLSGLDGSDEEVNLVNIGHASDVTFDGISFDSCKSHLLELCGCKNVVVKNCSFTSFTGTVASEGKEALQLDICNNDFNPSWNSSYNADNTVCQNITIQNCVFKDYPSAVGNHHTLLGHHSSGIKILNNRFENAMNTTGRAIGCFGFDNSEVKGNIITGKYGYGILVSGGSVSVENNTINNVAYTPLYMTTCGSYVLGSTGTTLENITASTVKGNTLVASGDIVPLSICSGTQVSEVSGNKISTTGNNALSITGEFNGKATQVGQLKNNEITTTATKAKSYGILVSTGAKVNSISENTIQSKLTAIWITSNSVVGSILNNSAVNSSAENGIYVYQSTVNNIKGNKITGSNGYGIRMTGESVVGTIDSNTVNSTDTAIEVNTGSKVTNITNNSMIKSSGKTGIIVTGAGSSATTIKSNNIIGAVNNGIAVMSSGKVGTIDSNTIKGKENAIHVSSGGQITTISANKEITSTTLSGIYVTGGTVSTIKGSTITGTGKYGIGVVSSGKVGTINSCAIQGKEAAIYDSNATITTISNNTKISSSTQSGIFVATTGVIGKISANTISSNKEYGIMINNPDITVSMGPNAYSSNTAGNEKIKAKIKKVDATGLATPKLQSVTNVSNGTKVAWSSVKFAAKYCVFGKKQGDSSWTKLGLTTGTSYTHTGAKSGYTYIYTVRCITSDGKTYASGFDSKGVSVYYVTAPKLTLTGQNGSIKLSWSASKGASKYRIYIKKSSGWSSIGDVAGTSYTYKSVASGKTYSFTIRCLVASGKLVSGYYSNGFSLKYLSAPKISSIKNSSSGVKLAWGGISGAAKYRIFYKTSANGSWTKLADTTAKSYTHTAAKNGTTYYYTVRCITSDAKAYNSGFNATGVKIQCKR